MFLRIEKLGFFGFSSGGPPCRALFARQREAALLQVVPEVVVDLDEVAGRVVDEAPSLTFPRLRSMLVEGVEGVELLKGVGDSSR